MADDQLPIPQSYIDAVKRFEGFTPRATWDVNNHRNGYGTDALHPNEVIDQTEAARRLHSELGKAAAMVDARYPGLPEGHRAGLTSLTFNAGPAWMNQGLGAAVGAGDWGKARDLMMNYNHSAGKVLPGLTDRRSVEASWMFGDPSKSVASAQPPAPFTPENYSAPSGVLGPPEGLFGQAPPSGVLPSPAPALPGAGPAAVVAGVGTPPADVTADAATRLGLAQKAIDAEKETQGEKNSKAMLALAQQLMVGSQPKPAQFAQMAPVDTGPFRPTPAQPASRLWDRPVRLRSLTFFQLGCSGEGTAHRM